MPEFSYGQRTARAARKTGKQFKSLRSRIANLETEVATLRASRQSWIKEAEDAKAENKRLGKALAQVGVMAQYAIGWELDDLRFRMNRIEDIVERAGLTTEEIAACQPPHHMRTDPRAALSGDDNE